MKKTFKSLLSVLLVFTMLMSLLPVGVFATEGEQNYDLRILTFEDAFSCFVSTPGLLTMGMIIIAEAILESGIGAEIGILLQKIVGHKSDSITDHYTHRTPSELLKELNKLKYR